MLKKAYAEYRNELPLHIDASDADHVRAWQRHERLSERGFMRLVAALDGTTRLDDLTTRCDLDFDNLAPVLTSLIAHDLLAFGQNGELCWRLPSSPTFVAPVAAIHENPSAKWNQFPCDLESRHARMRLLARDFPFQDTVRVGLIGDDDLLSTSLAAQGMFRPVVVEGHADVIACLQRISSLEDLSIDIHKVDLRDLDADISTVGFADTFITDPPYTYNGVLTFVYQGLRLLRPFDDTRFYVILNTMMLGHELHRIEHALVTSGATLLEIHPAANRYAFPTGYAEERRMRSLLDKIGSPARPVYSSSSSTFVWGAQEVDLARLRSMISSADIYRS